MFPGTEAWRTVGAGATCYTSDDDDFTVDPPLEAL
ncbi:MAG: hypothetical protein JWN57_2762 [Frankiales bacterium]|jgi:hypothetical protein|nr:hypothetical protein [Frankiales bacterium]